MPISAPKSLEDVFDTLYNCIESGQKPGDIERHYIIRRLREMSHIHPIQALVCFGVLATIYNNEDKARRYFQRALLYNNESVYVNFNYAISLLEFGYTDEAVTLLMKCLEKGVEASQHFDKMAFAAIRCGNSELSGKILNLAGKLKIQTNNIRLLAMDMLLSTDDSPEKEAELLNTVLSDETLKRGSRPYSEEEWNEMRDFADKLKEYM